MDWGGRVVVVTGASSGIGRVTARALAERGAVVVAVARRENHLRELAEEMHLHSPDSGYLAGDLGERAFAERVVDETAERYGRLDVLVNNAGIPKHKHIYHARVEEAEEVVRVNFFSCLWTTFAAIPVMLRQGEGSIVNVSSFASVVPPPRETLYTASKSAMDGFTRGLWIDLEGSNIHVALIVPGAIETEIWAKNEEPNAFRGRKAPPEVVANAIMEAVERRRRRIVVPRRSASLTAARVLGTLCPPLLRAGVRRLDPVPSSVIDAARERARAGKRLGDLEEN